jgi:two-component system sensor histidine kinase UhpB
MKTTLVLFVCSFLSFTTVAQKTDSLESVLQKTKADSTKTLLLSLLADELTKSDPAKSIKTAKKGLLLATKIGFEKGIFENYNSLASALRGQALFDSAVFYFHHAYAIAVSRKDPSGQAEICSSLGHCFMRKYEMDSARHYLEKGLVLARKIKDYRTEAGIYNNYGNVFLEESNFQKALDYFIMAARLYESQLADAYGQCLVLSNIGNIQYRLGNYDEALEYARQSMTIARNKSFTGSVGYAHKLLGRIYRKQKSFDMALEEYKKAQTIYRTLGDSRSVAEILQNIGNIYFDKEQHRDALTNYLQSLTLAKTISSKSLIAYAYSCVGQAYMALNKNDNALRYLDSARMAGQVIGNKYLVMETYRAMSDAYEAKGDYKKALSVHQQMVQLKDSITQSENRALAEETQAKYELERKEAQIALLEKDQELKTLAIGRHRAIQAGVAIAFVLIIIIAVLLINRYRIGNRAKRLAEIEAVRNTIARDLHDDIGSTLSTINIISKLAIQENPNGSSIHFRRIAEQSSLMMENMTDMVWSINPVNDSLDKVVVKMKVFTSEILEPKNISYHFSGDESLKGISMDAEKRKNLFLIFKEAINNAAKYSGATNVEITLQQTGKKLKMTVADNGNGFDEHNVKRGNGLGNMHARAKELSAQFTLTSILDRGTHIELEMPTT